MTTSVLQNKCSFGGNKRDETISYVIYYFLSSFFRLRKKRQKRGRGERGESVFRQNNYKSKMNITRNINFNDKQWMIMSVLHFAYRRRII